MPNPISNKDIIPNELVIVKGKLNFSRLSKQIAGEALAQENARRKQQGRPTIDRPFTTVTIDQAQILPKNPSQMTVTEAYVQGRFYASKSSRSLGGMSFTVNNKTRALPHVGLMDLGTGVIDEIKLESDLDGGLDVILVLRSFAGQQGNNGVSLDWVIISELRYYNRGASLDSILGVIGATAVNALPAEAQKINSDAAAPAIAANAFGDDLPFGEPEPAQQNTAPVMNANPFSAPQQPTPPTMPSPFGNPTGGIVAHPFGN